MMTLFNDLKHILGHGKVKLFQTKIVKDEQARLYHIRHKLIVRSITTPYCKARK